MPIKILKLNETDLSCRVVGMSTNMKTTSRGSNFVPFPDTKTRQIGNSRTSDETGYESRNVQCRTRSQSIERAGVINKWVWHGQYIYSHVFKY